MMVRDHLMATASSDEAEVNITAVRIKDDVLLPKGKIHHEVQRLHQSAPARMQPVSIVFKVDGRFVRKVAVSSTMGPGVRIDPAAVEDLIKQLH